MKNKPREASGHETIIKISSQGRIKKFLSKSSERSAAPEIAKKSMVAASRADHGLMISVSGIRGVIGGGFSPEVITKYAAAFGTWANGGTIVLGRDSRVSGDMVKTAAIASLLATGCKIIEIGIVPTPTTELAVKNLNAHGGIAITASHNPIEWNALKLIGPNGLFLNQQQMNEVLELAQRGNSTYASWDRIGKVEYYDYAVQNHIDQILELDYLNMASLRERKFRVVVDCVNGAGGVILPKLLKELGCEVFVLNEDPHGIFSRNPEPSVENLGALEEAVLEHHADIGFAVDPDVDRLAIVSNEGKAVGEELTLALAVDFVLSHRKGPVVVNASTTMAIDDIAKKHACPCHRTKIGEIHVSAKMHETSAVIGGEGNGGVILPDFHLGRDAATGIALLLQYICEKKVSVAECIGQLPTYVMKKDKVELSGMDVEPILEKILKKYSSEKIDRTDGIKIIFSDAWIHFRKSNTEPVVRIIAEAKSEAQLEKLLSTFTSYFHSA
jgi:phosphomannomutase